MIWKLLEFMTGSISFEQHWTWKRRCRLLISL